MAYKLSDGTSLSDGLRVTETETGKSGTVEEVSVVMLSDGPGVLVTWDVPKGTVQFVQSGDLVSLKHLIAGPPANLQGTTIITQKRVDKYLPSVPSLLLFSGLVAGVIYLTIRKK